MPASKAAATILARADRQIGGAAAGSAAAAADVLAAADGGAGADTSKPAGKRGRRRRRRKAKAAGRGQTGITDTGITEMGAVRHMRAPAKPAPRPSFDPMFARKGGNGRKDARHGAHGKGRVARMHGAGARPAYAALDLGTNNCRLLVAVPLAGRRFRVIDAFSRIVRLGEGMAISGRLSEAAMQRALEALSICAGKLAGHNLAGMRLIATEACRRAENGREFLLRVLQETGLDLEVVDRETEARLAAEGCGNLMDRGAEGAVLFDIGGGSSELILVNRRKAAGRRIADHIAAWTSLPIGVVTLSERHGGREVSRALFDVMVSDVLDELSGFEGRQTLADIWHPTRTHLLGTSGTVTTIAGVHLKLPRYDRRRVDGIWLSDGQVDAVIDTLISMDYAARAQNPCIGKERADLVLAGCAILQAIRLTWPSPRLRVADRGLREGILSELMHAAGEWAGQRGQAARRRVEVGRPV